MKTVDDFIKAIKYDYPGSIPVSVSILPATWKEYPKEIRLITKKYRDLFGNLAEVYQYDSSLPITYRPGHTTDEWGCVWTNVREGMEAYVTGHPIKTAADIVSLKIPDNRDGRLPHGFMYLRILDLMGFENAMMEFAMESDEIQMLIDKVLAYNCYQIEAVVDKIGEVMFFGDDLGTQRGLAIGPEKWRRYFKPCFKKMYDIVHARGKLIHMHSDGMIYEIIPDLVEAGVDIINPQFRANGLDNLVGTCKGKIPVNLDLDRQMLPFASPKDIDDHVRECVEALYLPAGGLALNLELGVDVPIENIEAAIAAVNKYRFYKN